jgi:pilus assembly protein CpaC
MKIRYQARPLAQMPAALAAVGLLLSSLLAFPVAAQAQKAVEVTKGTATTSTRVPAVTGNEFSVIGPAMDLSIGKSSLMSMPSAIQRVSVGNPDIVDISLINPMQLYMLGKNYGSTNLTIWRKDGAIVVLDVNVNIDAERMERKLRQLMPEETGIKVYPAADSVILTGVVSSAARAKYAGDIATAFVREIGRGLALPVVAGDGRVAAGSTMNVSSTAASGGAAGASNKVINLLRVSQGQQVMLEVKVAEVSKVLLEKLGVNFSATATTAGVTYGILSNLFSGNGVFSITAENGNSLRVDANKNETLVKVLAEPNIIAISGQEASFLAGGRLFIPVPTGSAGTFALDEREYGVGVKFTPTVLDGGRINLKVAPEVSDLGKGTSFKVNAVETVLPNFTTNRVQTTVQLMDGQSLAIAGLIKNNVGEVVSRVPLLGEIPILGTLFRSSEFQSNRTELVFLITPHLIKPLAEQPKLPTDSFTPPSRSEFFWEGKLEGSGNAEVPPDKPIARLEPAPSAALPQAAGSAAAQQAPLPAAPAPAPAQQAGSVSAAAVAPAAPAPAEPPAAEQMLAPPVPLNGLPDAPTSTEQVSPPLLAPAASPQGDPMLTVQADPAVLELE